MGEIGPCYLLYVGIVGEIGPCFSVYIPVLAVCRDSG